MAKHSEERKATGVEKMKKKSGELKRTWTKGLNVQAVCKQRFPESLGGIKICQLRRQAREQKWAELTEKQQKSLTQLSDSMKVALGLEKKIKGWKSLPPDKIAARLRQNEDLNRWSVPGKVLEERGRKG